MMSRQFLNLVTNSFTRGRRPAYTLHRIDPSIFFHPRSSQQAAIEEEEEFQLPPATMTFYGPCSEPRLDFIPLNSEGSSDKSILALDDNGRTTLYDAASHAVSAMPSLRARKVDPISLAVGNSVYVINSNPGRRHCFEALIHGRGPSSRRPADWYWHLLPPPPHVRPFNYVHCYESENDDSDGYDHEELFGIELDGSNANLVRHDDNDSLRALAGHHHIDGHTVVGDSKILISTLGGTTYSFDTASRAWSEEALEWSLPFTGRAEYVPELNLWFGISSQDNHLCAVDLAAAVPAAPVLRGMWEDVAEKKEWTLLRAYLVPLGSGKLFIAKFFNFSQKIPVEFGGWVYSRSDNFALFSGVEMVEKPGGGLRMVKHRSKRYAQHCWMSDWVS